MNNILKFFNDNHIPISWKTILVGRSLNSVNAEFIESYAKTILLNTTKLKICM